MPESEFEFEINKELVLSSGHLSLEEFNAASKGTYADIYKYGIRIYVLHVVDAYEYDTDVCELPILKRLVELAQEHDCKWLVFDEDGNQHKSLPYFEW